MNNLEIVKAARVASGLQGTGPASVVAAQGMEELLVLFVKDSNIDIMSLVDDWKFMRASHTFSTTIDISDYTYLRMFNTTTPNLKTYIKYTISYVDSGGHKSRLREVHYDNLTNTTSGPPTAYAIRPSDNAVILHPIPDGPYNISFEYYRGPQILSGNTDISWIPAPFHQLIVYKAVEKMSVYLGNPEIYRSYSTEAARYLGNLMRHEREGKRWRGQPLGGKMRKRFV